MVRTSIAEIATAETPIKLSNRIGPEMLPNWSIRHLCERFGDRTVPVEYNLSGIYRPRPEVKTGQYFRKTMPFLAAMESILYTDHYGICSYISTLDLARHMDLFGKDLPSLTDGQGTPPTERVLFVGNTPSGTHTHYDLPNNVVLVLEGEKRFWFFSPELSNRLQPYSDEFLCCNFSSLPDTKFLKIHAEEGAPNAIALTARRGDMIYIPSCWWHRVLNCEFTVSVTNLWDAEMSARRRPLYDRFAKALHRFEGDSGDDIYP